MYSIARSCSSISGCMRRCKCTVHKPSLALVVNVLLAYLTQEVREHEYTTPLHHT